MKHDIGLKFLDYLDRVVLQIYRAGKRLNRPPIDVQQRQLVRQQSPAAGAAAEPQQ
jgi:hypothetical protein